MAAQDLQAVLRRALALSSQGWAGDLFALVGEAVDRLAAEGGGAPGQTALAALVEIQRTVQPGEPFGDPTAWAARANLGELRRALEATLARLSEPGPRGH